MKRNGFTLVEMLVSLAVLGLMSTMLLDGVYQTGTFFRRESARSEARAELVAAQQLLRSRLEQLRPVALSGSGSSEVDIRGDEGVMSFVGPPLDRAAPTSLWRYRIAVTAAGDLVLYWGDTLDDRFDLEASTAGWRPIILARNVGALRMAYFGENLRGAGRAWQGVWNGRPQPPELVRVSITFRSGDGRVWPDLIVRPRATVNTACRIAKLTGRCEEGA